MPLHNFPSFDHGQVGLTRFPPNVEQITVKRENGLVWLIARRNETELKFPLNSGDCEHLISLLSSSKENASPSV
jgi:hypothetical protein